MTTYASCVNACTDATTTDEQTVRTPRPAKHGLLCNGCASKLREALEAIPDLWATLDRSLEPIRSGGGGGPGNFAENPVPVNLSVVAVRDRRSYNTVKTINDGAVHGMGVEAWGLPLEGAGAADKTAVPDALGTLNGWVECLRDDLAGGLAQPRMIWQTLTFERSPGGSICPRTIRVRRVKPVTIVGEVRYLLGAFDRLTERPWVDEAMREIRQVRAALMSVQGIRPPERVGRCFVLRGKAECGGSLLKTTDGAVECARCHDRWEGMGMVHLQHVLGGRMAT